MVRGLRRTEFTGSALTRLLARLTDVDFPESNLAFAERLSLWLSWTDAISLSAALEGDRAATPTHPRRERASERSTTACPEDDEFTRVRTSLLNAIAEDSAFPFPADKGQANSRTHMNASAATATASVPPEIPADFLAFRHRYLTRQHAMETSIGALRARVRARLSSRSPDMAKLAAVDAVMEQMLHARERSMLATVPRLLEKRFDRLRKAELEAQADVATSNDTDTNNGGAAQSAAQSPEWLRVFCKEMHDVLVAELELRLQPVEGLLEALRLKQSTGNTSSTHEATNSQ